ncbi:MAG: 30S ribosomal protein S17 [Candidatus Eisenbacteria bacterium]|nr:30S ribosomal protein S17 [Candidatus Eisenbacteria bacterium]
MVNKDDRRSRKVRVGEVVSDKMDKTAVVAVTRLVRHRMYNRFVKRTSRFKVHDEKNECRTGDVVRIMETRPLSKDKRWRLMEVVRRPE